MRDDWDGEPSVEHTARMDEAEVADAALPIYPNAGRPCDHDYGSLLVEMGDELVPACEGCGVARIYLP